jgi:phenylacetate-CoA ligase
MTQWQFPGDYEKNSRETLETVLNRVPGYRTWKTFDPGPGYPIDERYKKLPVLKKKDIREATPGGFVPESRNIKAGLDGEEISLVTTSGTTDISVTNIWYQPWWDASEKASWKLNAHSAKLATGYHPEAILANPMNVGIVSDNVDLTMKERRLSRFLYLNEKSNPVAWTPAFMKRMINEIAVFQPVVFEANPSLLARLCRYVHSSELNVYQPGLIVLTYEYPTLLQIRQIKRIFSCPVISSYGTTETGYVFMQCEAGKFHQNSDFCRVDFQPLKKEQGGPKIGRILVTTFNNPWYYMIRFDVGDLVSIEPSGNCDCGRQTGMILSAIEGRSLSTTITCEGRLVTLHQADIELSELNGINEYRLEQTGTCEYLLYLVTDRKDHDRLELEAAERIKNLYGGNARITFRYEEALAPESSGKYCHVKAIFPINVDDYVEN